MPRKTSVYTTASIRSGSIIGDTEDRTTATDAPSTRMRGSAIRKSTMFFPNPRDHLGEGGLGLAPS